MKIHGNAYVCSVAKRLIHYFKCFIRGANAVGYTSYPDNVVRQFIQRAAANGIDVFRVFDSLNSLDNMHVAIDEVRAQNKIAEVALCYTGIFLIATVQNTI